MRSKKQFLCFLFLTMYMTYTYRSYSQLLKSVMYDFDGLDIGQTNLPENDYHTNDLTYKIAANPLAASDILGDRVLQINLNWNKGSGSFVRGYLRYIEFNPFEDRFNFYFYNPSGNNQSANIDILLADDDDQSNTYSINSDDLWKKNIIIPPGSGWQLISIPLKDFTDSNGGGNGVFDMAFTQNKGMLLQMEIRFNKSSSSINPTFFMDMIAFSDGYLPVGSTPLNLPGKSSSDYCLLGAFTSEKKGESYLTPTHIESLFPADPTKHLKYVNWFIQFGMDGSTTAKELPGNEVKTLLSNGYTPIITWEPMFKGYSRLDPVQPRLRNIINGDYNSYIDAFADRLKSFNDTVIIRFMHEFDGNWYSWSITENNQDPNLYIAAWRKVVDRFRARGATKVKWMWCINANYAPYKSYNWSVKAYPGNNYVDIVATDVYNAHFPVDLPWWFSFRYKAAESYYYLVKYFPSKPLFICEEGCRERYSSESASSQTKAQWIPKMDKELQSNFHKTRALISFSAYNVYDWRINSSTSAQNSYRDNIWYDGYYFKHQQSSTLKVSITSPLNGTTFGTPTNINITANAYTSSGTITKVQFFSGTNKIGEDVSAPYSFTWMNVTTGNYALRTVVINSSGASASSSIVNISVTSCPKPIITANGPTTMCSGSVTLKTNYVSGNLYRWEKNGVDITGATSNVYTASSTGQYQVKVIQGSCITWSSPVTVKIQSGLSASITPGGPTTFCIGGKVILYANTCSGFTYQWIKDGLNISGATAATYTATSTGYYQVRVTQSGSNAWSSKIYIQVNNCTREEEMEYENVPDEPLSIDIDSSHFQMKVFPNPTSGLFTIQLNMLQIENEKIEIILINTLGQLCFMKTITPFDQTINEIVELDNSFPAGIYTLHIAVGDKSESTSVILSK
jgi:hypothetical protein